MIPWNVGTDPHLTHLDTRVYFVLAACRREDRASIGTRLIAQYACTSQRRVVESLKSLRDYGHLEISAKFGARSEYRLTAGKFAKKEGQDGAGGKTSIGEGSEGVDAAKTTVSAPPLICPECHKPRRGLMRVGWCRTCNSAKGTEKIARRVAKEEIAAEKTA
jgi:hypothetical protein